MRLPLLQADAWWRASSRALLPISSWALFQPVARNPTTVFSIKSLHQTTKESNSQLNRDANNWSVSAGSTNAQNVDADVKSALKSPPLVKDEAEVFAAATRKPRRHTEAQRLALLATIERSRAEGFPHLRKAIEKSRANGWLEQKKAVKTKHARFVQEIEAADKRKLAEDPTFKPLPLPQRKAAEDYSRYVKKQIPCPQPDCASLLAHEEALKVHLRRVHGGRSAEAPFKCKHPDCDRHYETAHKAYNHFQFVHLPKVQCPVCDRKLKHYGLRNHLRKTHGIEAETVLAEVMRRLST